MAASPRYPKYNGNAKAENKTIMNNLKNDSTSRKRSGAKSCTASSGPTEQLLTQQPQKTSFSLSYRIDAVIPAEIDVPSLGRTIFPEDVELNEELLMDRLDMIEER